MRLSGMPVSPFEALEIVRQGLEKKIEQTKYEMRERFATLCDAIDEVHPEIILDYACRIMEREGAAYAKMQNNARNDGNLDLLNKYNEEFDKKLDELQKEAKEIFKAFKRGHAEMRKELEHGSNDKAGESGEGEPACDDVQPES
jgi:hypothetical protein